MILLDEFNSLSLHLNSDYYKGTKAFQMPKVLYYVKKGGDNGCPESFSIMLKSI